MKFLVIFFLLFSSLSFARGSHGGHVHVNGYTRHNGTYVQPHYRTAPDGTKMNNWSHIGNVNPYTGKVGTNTDSSPNYRGTGYYGSSYNTSPIYNTNNMPPPPPNLYIQQ